MSASLLAAAFALVGFFTALSVIRIKQKTKPQTPSSSFKTIGIASVLKRHSYCIAAQATVLDALQCMTGNKTSGLPVVTADNQVCGFIADGDIIRYMASKDLENAGFASMYPLWHNTKDLDARLAELAQIKVLELATKKVVFVDIADDMEVLFQVFSDKRIKKVPVLEAGKLVGTVSRSDLLRQLMAQSSLKPGCRMPG